MSTNYIADRIRETRNKRRLSQDKMAKAMGISQPKYSKIENNPNLMRLSHLFEIAEILEVSVAFLTDDGENWEDYVRHTSWVEKQYIDHTNWLNQQLKEKQKAYDRLQKENIQEEQRLREDLRATRKELYQDKTEMTRTLGKKDSMIRELVAKVSKSKRIVSNTKKSVENLLALFSVEFWVEHANVDQNKNPIDLNSLETFLRPFRKAIYEEINNIDKTIEEIEVPQIE